MYAWLMENRELSPLLREGTDRLGKFLLTSVIERTGIKFHDDRGHTPSGVWMTMVAEMAGMAHSWDPFRPKGWCRFGNPVAAFPEEENVPSLGDILIFNTEPMVVGLYVGEDDNRYHVLGARELTNADLYWVNKEALMTARRHPTQEFLGIRRLNEDGSLI